MALNIFVFARLIFLLFFISCTEGGKGKGKGGYAKGPPPIGFNVPPASNSHHGGSAGKNEHQQPVIHQTIKHKTVINQAPGSQFQSPSLGDSLAHGIAAGVGSAIGHNMINGGNNRPKDPNVILVAEGVYVNGEIVNLSTTTPKPTRVIIIKNKSSHPRSDLTVCFVILVIMSAFI